MQQNVCLEILKHCNSIGRALPVFSFIWNNDVFLRDQWNGWELGFRIPVKIHSFVSPQWIGCSHWRAFMNTLVPIFDSQLNSHFNMLDWSIIDEAYQCQRIM